MVGQDAPVGVHEEPASLTTPGRCLGVDQDDGAGGLGGQLLERPGFLGEPFRREEERPEQGGPEHREGRWP